MQHLSLRLEAPFILLTFFSFTSPLGQSSIGHKQRLKTGILFGIRELDETFYMLWRRAFTSSPEAACEFPSCLFFVCLWSFLLVVYLLSTILPGGVI